MSGGHRSKQNQFTVHDMQIGAIDQYGLTIERMRIRVIEKVAWTLANGASQQVNGQFYPNELINLPKSIHNTCYGKNAENRNSSIGRRSS